MIRKVGIFDNAIILVPYEVKEGGFKESVSIFFTDIDLDTETILRYYAVR